MELPYHPQLALYETIFVRDFPKEELAHRYDELAQLLETVVSDHASQLFRSNIELGEDPVQRTAELNRLLRLAKDEPRIGLPILRSLLDKLSDLPWSDDDFKVLDRILELLTQDGLPKVWVGLFKRAGVLGSWAQKTEMPLLAKERRQEALVNIDRALACTGVSAESQATMHAMRGELLIADENWQMAVNSLTVASQSEHRKLQRAHLLLRRGYAYRELRQAEAACLDFSEAIDSRSLNPKEMSTAHLGRGLSLGELNRSKESIADLTKVLEIKDTDSGDLMTARFGRAISYKQLGDSASALADYNVVISGDSTNLALRLKTLHNRGVLLLELGKIEDAIRDLTEVQSQSVPGSESAIAAQVNRALAYTKLEQWALALADARSVLHTPTPHANDQAYALYAAVQSNVGLGMLESAVSTYAQLESLPGVKQDLRAAAMVALGWGAYLQKDYRRAVEWARGAMAVDAVARCTAAANAGLALLHLGDIAAANEEYAILIKHCNELADLESALNDLHAALQVKPLLPGAQQIYDNLMARRTALRPATTPSA